MMIYKFIMLFLKLFNKQSSDTGSDFAHQRITGELGKQGRDEVPAGWGGGLRGRSPAKPPTRSGGSLR